MTEIYVTVNQLDYPIDVAPSIDPRRAVVDRIRTSFPMELQKCNQWLLWRYEQRAKGNASKVPCGLDSSRADVTDPHNYLSFDNACDAYLTGVFDGIGFVFTDTDPYCGIDLDDCIVNNTIEPQATRAIEQICTYTEKSISGTGIHMIARANLPAGGRKSKGHKTEFYDQARFFVVTGNHVPGTPNTVEDGQDEIENLHGRIFPLPPSKPCNHRPPTPVALDDQALIDEMFSGKRGAKIRALWDGDSSAYSDDESAADLALCNDLAYWSGRDASRMDRLFRQSGRMRNKWDRPARTGETYGQGTIRLACLTTQKTFAPPKIKPVLTGMGTPGGNEPDTNERLPRYVVDGGHICEVKVSINDRTGDTDIQYIQLCNFAAIITADILRDDGDEITRHLAITGTLDNGRSLPEISVNAADFGAMEWVAGEWGGRPIVEPGQSIKNKLRHAIQVLSAKIMTERHLYEHTGWRMIDGQRAFLHAGGAIGVSGVSVELPGRLSDYRFPDDNAISPVDAMRESIRLMEVAPLRITGPLWGLTYFAPLSSMSPPAFMTNLQGPSGAKKSSVAALCINHFGVAFHEKHMPDDWMSTANSIERMAFLAKDVLFIVDDFRPAESRAEEREQTDKLGRIARAVGNRAARGRLTSSRKSARSYVPRGMVGMTAELGATGRSSVARQLTITVKENDIDLAKLTAAQKQRHVYAYAMRGYIEWLSKHYDDVAETIRRNVIEQRNEFATAGMHGRLPDAAAQLYVGFDLALRWATSIGAITDEFADRLCNTFKQELRNIAWQQNEIVNRENPATKFMTMIVTLLAQGKAAITPKPGSTTASVLGSQSGEKIGHWDDNNIFLYPPAVLRMVHRAISEMGGHFSADTTTLGRDLKDAGWLSKTGGERRTQVALRVAGYDEERPYFYVIGIHKFKELLATMGFEFSEIYEFPKINYEK